MLAFVGLGSSLGERRSMLAAADRDLSELPGTVVTARSQIYETTPVEVTGGLFLNAVVALETTLPPLRLLHHMLPIEQAHGRTRTLPPGPRTLDLDLLLALDDGRSVEHESDELRLPHPALLRRDFALRPLCELAPHVVVGDRTIAEHLAAIPESELTVVRILHEPG